MECLPFLRKVSIFQNLGADALHIIAGIVTEASYRKGEVIFHNNDEGDCLFILKSGLVKVAIFDGKGKEDILKIVYPSDCFGEMSLLDGIPRSATVIALEDSCVLVIAREQFTRLISAYPQLSLDILAMLSRRLRKADEKIATLRFADAYGKIARTLLNLSGNRNGEIEFDFSRDILGGLAGLTRETVSRILKEFHTHGCIRVEGRKITILDVVALEKEALR